MVGKLALSMHTTVSTNIGDLKADNLNVWLFGCSVNN